MDITPFQEFSGFFGPDDLDAMTTAYVAAWSQLWAMGVAITPRQIGVMKKKLAQISKSTQRQLPRRSRLTWTGIFSNLVLYGNEPIAAPKRTATEAAVPLLQPTVFQPLAYAAFL